MNVATGRTLALHLQRSSARARSSFGPANVGNNLANLDVLGSSAVPENNIEMISKDSIIFSNMKVVRSPNKQGTLVAALLLDNQILELNTSSISKKGPLDLTTTELFTLLEALYPKPELFVLGLGGSSRMLGPETRKHFAELGIMLEVGDTKSAVLSYDLLATERSPKQELRAEHVGVRSKRKDTQGVEHEADSMVLAKLLSQSCNLLVDFGSSLALRQVLERTPFSLQTVAHRQQPQVIGEARERRGGQQDNPGSRDRVWGRETDHHRPDRLRQEMDREQLGLQEAKLLAGQHLERPDRGHERVERRGSENIRISKQVDSSQHGKN
ncbi:hypothetical protein KL914_004123 [Ogataea haglerorum]|uniref:NADH dehydrogenase [ubiquinone] 1 alpha subcomplex assembly factor 3 n=1 Tax=Ogataea haglerorum TaxID=1937702 RepID=A0ABQ7RHC9_9ASCO|nr:hypothetical protein KL914_004123 [Ogataea haglerorum]KAG7765560.1 hypothetical protein KL946_002617 [Ogataea haglerorum]